MLSIVFVVAMGCGPNKLTGKAEVQGSVPGFSLSSSNGFSIGRTMPPNAEIMIATTELACLTIDTSDHVTIDLGDMSPGTYRIRSGYPYRTSLAHDEARAHACPAQRTKLPCDEKVTGGTVTITRYDADGAGVIEGTFDIVFADGEISGSFTAPRCD